MKYIFLSIMFIICQACNNEKDVAAGNTEGASIKETSDVIDYIVPASSFHQYMLVRDSSYTPIKYSAAGITPLDLSIINKTDSASLHPFAHLLVYNSNRTKALDLFSGNFIITEKRGKTFAARGEPDTELALIDVSAKTKTRLLYVGPSYTLTDAVWINDSTVGVTGGEIIKEGQLQPMLWKLDITKKTAALYRYTDTLIVELSDYFAKRYPRVAF